MAKTMDDVWFLLGELHAHAVRLRQTWTLYQDLYVNRKRVDVMRAKAPVTFSILQPVLYESIFMAITRFIDPARSSGNDTASLEQLIKAIPAGHDSKTPCFWATAHTSVRRT